MLCAAHAGLWPAWGRLIVMGFSASLASGYMAASTGKRKILNGPTATGNHCPEGCTLIDFPGPQFAGMAQTGSAEASYYTWVDQFDVLGLGKNAPIATVTSTNYCRPGRGPVCRSVSSVSDRLFYQVDGRRIDDPGAGWKGKALWPTFATRAMFHLKPEKAPDPRWSGSSFVPIRSRASPAVAVLRPIARHSKHTMPAGERRSICPLRYPELERAGDHCHIARPANGWSDWSRAHWSISPWSAPILCSNVCQNTIFFIPP